MKKIENIVIIKESMDKESLFTRAACFMGLPRLRLAMTMKNTLAMTFSALSFVLSFGIASESFAEKCISDGETESGGKYENTNTSCKSCGLNCDWEIVGTKLIVSPSSGATGVDIRTFKGSGSDIAPWRGQTVTEAEIKNGITTLGEYAFYQMQGITKITLPEGLGTIQYGAFNKTGITSIDLPKSITDIGGAVFANTSLTSVTIPDGVQRLNNSLFENDNGLTSVFIPDTINSVWTAPYSIFSGSSVSDIYCVNTHGQCASVKNLLRQNDLLDGKNFNAVKAVQGCQNYNSSGCADCYSTWHQNESGSCDCKNGKHIEGHACVANSDANCNTEIGGKCVECMNDMLEQDGKCVTSCGAGYKDMGGFCNRVRYTPAEAAAVANDDNTNVVTITFRK